MEIYIYLENEGIDVWRPVEARHIKDNLYLIPKETIIPDEEKWQFQPGIVVCCIHGEVSGEKCLIAVERT